MASLQGHKAGSECYDQTSDPHFIITVCSETTSIFHTSAKPHTHSAQGTEPNRAQHVLNTYCVPVPQWASPAQTTSYT